LHDAMPDSRELERFPAKSRRKIRRAGQTGEPVFTSHAALFIGVDILLMTIKFGTAGNRRLLRLSRFFAVPLNQYYKGLCQASWHA
jgi:hypothetical protein